MLQHDNQSTSSLLEVQGLKKYYFMNGSLGKLGGVKGTVKAVNEVSLSLYQNETYGLVGESGCGKSTLGRTILKLIEPTDGKVIYNGEDILQLNRNDLRPFRKELQMVFQDPYTSLNPRKRVGQILEEPLAIHNIGERKDRTDMVMDILRKVGLQVDHYYRYPHELSGGQRQRIGIARALVVNPKVIILDEPVSALDVSIQSQIINLLEEIQAEFNLSYLFIAHDMSVVRHISDRIGVMYLGNLVEEGPNELLFEEPLHPYTKALLSAVPVANPKLKRERIMLKGEIPSPFNPPSGCSFHTRCPFAMDKCKTETPVKVEVSTKHFVSCHLYE
ncbi:dipeptide ABC transporter ATP-binding protein [Robertmurraya massiliosenegalensis]|uniref:ABC transporter ATP-binding protein n=1 Tax=Robertmurraya TaxID=2837507 RepID=UPI0039A68C75